MDDFRGELSEVGIDAEPQSGVADGGLSFDCDDDDEGGEEGVVLLVAMEAGEGAEITDEALLGALRPEERRLPAPTGSAPGPLGLGEPVITAFAIHLFTVGGRSPTSATLDAPDRLEPGLSERADNPLVPPGSDGFEAILDHNLCWMIRVVHLQGINSGLERQFQ